ncbi:MAG: phosphoribosylanthranilate isomerase [Trueperaceae bacterium]|nr:phosphoribosylanthranilate isomerase [Trueperaceae bacterium]
MSRVRVKVCGVTRPQDARAAEAAGADAIGVIFAPGSRRRVTPAEAADVTAAVGPFVRRVGVFVDADDATLHAAIDAAHLDAVQLHGDATDALCARLRRRVTVIRAVRFDPGDTPDAWAGRPVDAVLLDGPKPGSGTAFDWSTAAAWRGAPRLIVAGGLHPGNVADAVGAMAPYAVDVASGVEASPGVKDPAKLAAFVAAVRDAEPGSAP